MAACTSYASSNSSSSDSESDNECTVDVAKFIVPKDAFSKVLSNLCKEELIVKSSRGHLVISFADAFASSATAKEVLNFSEYVTQQLQSCLKMSLHKIWRNFHVLRLSKSIQSKWQTCTKVLNLPEEVLGASDTVLQLILKRMMQSVIQDITASRPTPQSPAMVGPSLRELNVIRYIAGYVVLKMKKKFPLHSSFFNDNIVDNTCNYINIQTVEEYSRVWVEQVDRGGLCNVSDNFFNLLKEIECVCRKYLDVRASPVESLTVKMREDAVTCSAVTSLWNMITCPIPQKDSSVILKAIVTLWINIRVHSFAERWTDAIQAKKIAVASHTKALRKTLKRKGTEKDST